MKNKTNYSNLLLFAILSILFIPACSLDYENTGAINRGNVWKDKKMINAFLIDIHGGMMPGWPTNGNDTDEGFNKPGSLGDYQRGIIDVEKTASGLGYSNIEKINFFLEKIATVPNTVLTDKEKENLTGQALFWRAWDYWGKVTTFGGVPLSPQ